MQRILIYGAGGGGEHMFQEMRDRSEPYEILAFVDQRIGGTIKNDLPVIFPDDLYKYDFDVIFVATQDNTVPIMLNEKFGIPVEKINHSRYFNSMEVAVRVKALENFHKICDTYNITGSTAEVGVFQGDFAKHINRLFPDSTLYLYDTFEGFSERDKEHEAPETAVTSYTHYSNTSTEAVLNKMPNPDKVVIRKGIFPDTAAGENEKYVFVSIDPDLYIPTLAALEYFYPKVVHGGAIFVHDYFSSEDPGVFKAVSEFKSRNKLSISSLGDFRTLVITKPF